jgi:hypothetical protein
MDCSLPPERVREILDEAHRSDVPSGRLVLTAELIRHALSASCPHRRPPAFLGLAGTAPSRGAPMRTTRVRAARTVLATATLSLATVLATAVAGALPAAVQHRVATGAAILGLDLPRPQRTPSDVDAASRDGEPGTPGADAARDGAGGGSRIEAGNDGVASSAHARDPAGGARSGTDHDAASSGEEAASPETRGRSGRPKDAETLAVAATIPDPAAITSRDGGVTPPTGGDGCERRLPASASSTPS